MTDQPTLDRAALRALAEAADGKLKKWVNIETASLLALLDENERLRTAMREALDYLTSDNGFRAADPIDVLRTALGDEGDKHE